MSRRPDRFREDPLRGIGPRHRELVVALRALLEATEGSLDEIGAALRTRLEQPSVARPGKRLSELAMGSRFPSGRELQTLVRVCTPTAEQRERFAVLYSQAQVERRARPASTSSEWAPAEGVSGRLAGQLAPDRLRHRQQELAELAEFCLGNEPYGWWQAPPWAGKTALLSWFVLHPPRGVDLVAFFVTRRLPGCSDSAGFVLAVVEQLALMRSGGPVRPADRIPFGELLHMLEQASDRSHRRNRRFVLVVDGLDEDTGAPDLPSVASLLPRRPPSNLRVVLSGRPHPGLPLDVADNHPLHRVRPRPLAAYHGSGNLRRSAEGELHRLVAGPPLGRDVAGLVTAAGGGLTLADLERLTGRPPLDLLPLLGGVFGRSLDTEQLPTSWRDPARAYVFAHDTLRETAEKQFGATLRAYRDRIHEWADEYRARGWPLDTPDYLLRRYARLLIGTNDLARLLDLVLAPSRHLSQYSLTGSDVLAIDEVNAAARLVAHDPRPDLVALLRLAILRDGFDAANHATPLTLPGVWARIGDTRRAVELAANMPDPAWRARALAYLADTFVDTASTDRARATIEDAIPTAAGISDPADRAAALTRLAESAARAGDGHLALELAERAAIAAREVLTPDEYAEILRELVASASAMGLHDHAECLVHRIGDPWTHAMATTDMIRTAITACRYDGALAERAHRVAAGISDPDARAGALSALVQVLAPIGEHHSALSTLATLGPPTGHLGQVHVVTALLAAGHRSDAEQLARAIAEPQAHDTAVVSLVQEAAGVPDFERSEQLADTIDSPEAKIWALCGLAEAMAEAGTADRALALTDLAATVIGRLTDRDAGDRALARLATAVALAGDVDGAEHVAADIHDPQCRAGALTDLAMIAAAADRTDRARALTELATAAARSGAGIVDRALVRCELLKAAWEVGDHERVDRLRNGITADAELLSDPAEQRLVHHQLQRLAQPHHRKIPHARPNDRATPTGPSTDPLEHVQALIAQLSSMASAGDRARAVLDEAVDTARRIHHADIAATMRALALLAYARLRPPAEPDAALIALIAELTFDAQWPTALLVTALLDQPAMAAVIDAALTDLTSE